MTDEKKSLSKNVIAILAGILIAGLIVFGIIFALTNKKDDNGGSNNNNKDNTTLVGSTAMSDELDIVDNFSKEASLANLMSALETANLTETLRGGPFTVFAPNNQAFSKLPAVTLENLLKPENKKQLTDILTFHLIAGTFKVEDLQNNQEITTINGAKLIVKKEGDTTLIGNAKITTADVVQKNGVAHIIDTVLIPETKEIKLTNVGGVEVSSEKDFLENLALLPNLTTVAAAVQVSNLSSTLKSEGPFTIFVPSNPAFTKLPAGTVEDLLKTESRAKLIGILTYHVIPGKLLIEDLKDGQVLTSLSGNKLKIKIEGTKISIIGDKNDNIAVIQNADVIQKNGVAHIIDTVLMPPVL
jgi:uncharacterized surface protein with fasciclin (FAS1) repeats